MSKQPTNSLKPFFTVWSGQAVSLLGSQLVQFALIWWLTETTASATVLAMASLVGLMPQVVLGPFIGVWVDRWNRRLIMLVADSVVALATILLAYLFWIEVADIWHVFLILFVRALAGSFHYPAMASSTTLMVPESQLTRIQGLNQTLNGGLSIASAPLGALLLSVWSMQWILAIDVITALFAIAPLLFINIPQPNRQPNGDSAAGPNSYWTDFREGLSFMRGWRQLMVFTGMAMIVKILLNPAFSLIPILVTQHFGGGAVQLSFVEAAAGIGLLLGGVLLSAWGGFKRRIMTSMAGLAGLGAGLIVMGAAPANLFTVGVAGALLVGLTIPLLDGPLMAILQAAIAPEMQGRVFMMFSSLLSSTVPIGLLIAGPVADAVGVRLWFIAAGILTLVMAGIGLFKPSMIDLESNKKELLPAAAAMAGEPIGSELTAI